MSRLIEPTEQGLYCKAGDFYIDPWRPVERAVVTHAHSDHAASGCRHYLTSSDGAGVLRQRIDEDAAIQPLAYDTPLTIGDITLSLHPAGHILGSAQIRIEHEGETWVVSGDYKTEPDTTCAPYAPVPCHTFITESTFGLPIYRWPDPAAEARALNEWWRTNQSNGVTSLVFAYALGKAQRVLAALDPTIGPILVHGAVDRLLPHYRAAGIKLPEVQHAGAEQAKAHKGRALVIAPPSALATTWQRKFGRASTAFVSGWMRLRGTRRRRSVDRGFILSDHVDWPGLLRAIDESGAEHIGVTHGYAEQTARYLRDQGRDAFILPTRYTGESAEDDGETVEPGEPDAP